MPVRPPCSSLRRRASRSAQLLRVVRALREQLRVFAGSQEPLDDLEGDVLRHARAALAGNEQRLLRREPELIHKVFPFAARGRRGAHAARAGLQIWKVGQVRLDGHPDVAQLLDLEQFRQVDVSKARLAVPKSDAERQAFTEDGFPYRSAPPAEQQANSWQA
jgi:hypothetical protein